jgi:hypothetical protein
MIVLQLQRWVIECLGRTTYFVLAVRICLSIVGLIFCLLLSCELFWDEQVKSIFVPTEQATLTNELCSPLVATLPLEVLFFF